MDLLTFLSLKIVPFKDGVDSTVNALFLSCFVSSLLAALSCITCVHILLFRRQCTHTAIRSCYCKDQGAKSLSRMNFDKPGADQKRLSSALLVRWASVCQIRILFFQKIKTFIQIITGTVLMIDCR